jgi:cytochrome c oxidase subunit III
MSAAALREPWRRLSRQREAATFGMWVFLTSELLFFSGMILIYAACRYLQPAGFLAAARETNVWFGTINTMVLLTSSFAMAVAAQAGDAKLRRLAIACLAATVVLGLAFLTIKGFEYREDIQKHLLPGAAFAIATPGAQLFFSIYWVMTGVHA